MGEWAVHFFLDGETTNGTENWWENFSKIDT
jgi:hypothetical protein